jgi:hypothetical protein
MAVKVLVDGREVGLDAPVQAIDGQVLVPLRPVLEALDLTVVWRGTRQAVGVTGRDELEVPVNGEYTEVWRLEKRFKAPLRVVANHTMIPYQYLSEFLDVDTRYDAAGGTIRIDRRPTAPAPSKERPPFIAFDPRLVWAVLGGALVAGIATFGLRRQPRMAKAAGEAGRFLRRLGEPGRAVAPGPDEIRTMSRILAAVRPPRGGEFDPLLHVGEKLSPALCGLLLLGANPSAGGGASEARRFWDLDAGQAAESAAEGRTLLEAVRFRASLDPAFRSVLLKTAGLSSGFSIMPAISDADRLAQTGRRYASFYDRPHNVALATTLPTISDGVLRRLAIDRGRNLKGIDIFLPDPRLKVGGAPTGFRLLIDRWLRAPGMLLDPLDFPRPAATALASLPAHIIVTIAAAAWIGRRSPVRVHLCTGEFLPFGLALLEDDERLLSEVSLVPPGLPPRAGILLQEDPEPDGSFRGEARRRLLRWDEERRREGRLATLEAGPGFDGERFARGLASLAGEAAAAAAAVLAERGLAIERRRLEAALSGRHGPRQVISAVVDLFAGASGSSGQSPLATDPRRLAAVISRVLNQVRPTR